MHAEGPVLHTTFIYLVTTFNYQGMLVVQEEPSIIFQTFVKSKADRMT